MPRSSAVRFSHFLPSLLLLLAGLAAAYVKDLNVFFTSLFNVLPTLVLLLGGAYCAVYRRQRELFLMVTVYIAYFLLDTQTDYYRDNGKVRDDAAVVFHLCCLLLPLLFGLFAAWQERTHLFQDMVARFAVLLAFGSVALGLEQSYPQALLMWLSEIRWPTLHGAWMSLIQLSYPVFIASFLLLAWQYWRNPRPLHAAQLVGLLGLFWMLPKTFILPFTLNIMCSQVMLMIAAAVAHEAYQMAFRDELTGLPGRRALNERMQRLGRNYVLAMGDVDHFKKFNDTHGHDVGDQVCAWSPASCRKSAGAVGHIATAVKNLLWCSQAKPSKSVCRIWKSSANPSPPTTSSCAIRTTVPRMTSRDASVARVQAPRVYRSPSASASPNGWSSARRKKCSNPLTRRSTAPKARGETV